MINRHSEYIGDNWRRPKSSIPNLLQRFGLEQRTATTETATKKLEKQNLTFTLNIENNLNRFVVFLEKVLQIATEFGS